MFHSINDTAAFTALDRPQQAAIWTGFFDALDRGSAGRHPHYAVLAPLYAAGDYITGGEGLAEPAQPFDHHVEDRDLVDLGEPPF